MSFNARDKNLTIKTLILLLSAFLSFLALDNARRFHPDEAFYMTIARHAAVNGDWMLIAEPLDKTPLTFYSNALALVFFAVETDNDGVLQLDPLKGEFAGRIPSTLMSVLLVAVGMQLAQVTSRNRRVTLLTGTLLTLTPLRIVFAPTAFTDLPMLLFGILSLWMVARHKVAWAGVWFAISIAAKPQVVFYLPLIIGIILLQRQSIRQIMLLMMQFIVPVALIIGLLGWWDSIRVAAGADSFYALGQSRYTVTIITPLHEYPDRFALWWDTNQYLFGIDWITGAALLLSGLLTLEAIVKKKVTALQILLWLWVIGFVGIHMMLTINLFDRNQLVLMPVMLILVSIVFATIQYRTLIISFLLSCGLFAVVFALRPAPIGSDDGSHDGIDTLANYLNHKPVATVIYDRWLDWELDYYMGQWTDKRRVYYPTPAQLVEGALSLDETGTRYFVAPLDINLSPWLTALRNANFNVTDDYSTENFIVYSVEPPE